MAAIRTAPTMGGACRKIYPGYSAVGDNQQHHRHHIEERQAMQIDEKHRRQQQAVFQEAGWSSRLRTEREGIGDDGGV